MGMGMGMGIIMLGEAEEGEPAQTRFNLLSKKNPYIQVAGEAGRVYPPTNVLYPPHVGHVHVHPYLLYSTLPTYLVH